MKKRSKGTVGQFGTVEGSRPREVSKGIPFLLRVLLWQLWPHLYDTLGLCSMLVVTSKNWLLDVEIRVVEVTSPKRVLLNSFYLVSGKLSPTPLSSTRPIESTDNCAG